MSDTGEPAVEAPVFSDEQAAYMDKMLEKQTDKLTSHFGRIVSKQFEEKYLPEIKKSQVNPEEMNEQLSNKLFGGDVNGTVRDIILKEREERNHLVTQKEQAVEKEMEKFQDKPLFKATEKDIKKIALEALKKGHPPAPAVELAYEKAGRAFLENKDPDYKLGMAGQGKAPVRTKVTKMPAELKAAAQRDIADGYFKDEADYLAQLPLSIKEKYGI